MVIDGPRCGIVLIAPYLAEQFVPRDHTLGVLHQKLQGIKLTRRQFDERSVANDFHFREVDCDSIKGCDIANLYSARAPDRGTYTRQQFTRTKGLGYVII